MAEELIALLDLLDLEQLAVETVVLVTDQTQMLTVVVVVEEVVYPLIQMVVMVDQV